MGGDRCGGCRGGADQPENDRGGKRRKLYKEHLELSHPRVQEGMENGRCFKGSLRMSRYNPTEGWITRPEDGKVCSDSHWRHGLVNRSVSIVVMSILHKDVCSTCLRVSALLPHVTRPP